MTNDHAGEKSYARRIITSPITYVAGLATVAVLGISSCGKNADPVYAVKDLRVGNHEYTLDSVSVKNGTYRVTDDELTPTGTVGTTYKIQNHWTGFEITGIDVDSAYGDAKWTKLTHIGPKTPGSDLLSAREGNVKGILQVIKDALDAKAKAPAERHPPVVE